MVDGWPKSWRTGCPQNMDQKWQFSGVFQASAGNLLPHPLPHIAERHPNQTIFAGLNIEQFMAILLTP
jgi:hypothetical protein